MALKYAQIKFNGGRGALLCNRCHTIIETGAQVLDKEDKKYFCNKPDCENKYDK